MEGTKKNGKKKKIFPQYSFDRAAKEWVKGTEHAIRVPYRSPEIFAYAQEMRTANIAWTLVIVEGEKDVESGLVWFPDLMDVQVTTVCQGAKTGDGEAIWEESHTEYLLKFGPQAVIVIADRDKPGLNAAEVIAKKVLAAGIPVAIYLPHPSLGDDGADLTDHIEAGFSYEELEPYEMQRPTPTVEERQQQTWDANTGIAAEQYRFFGDSLADRVMYLPGTEDPWHVRQGESAMFAPSESQVHRMGLRLMMRRYNDAVADSVPRAMENRLRSHCEISKVQNAMKASIADLTVTLDDIAEHAYHYLLNCPNGIIDLRNGKPIPNDQDYRFTKQTRVNFNPDAKCPKFLKMLQELQPDDHTRAWLHRVMGNGLTGRLEPLVVVFFGRGADGKTTFANVIQYVLGDFAVSTKADTWLRSKMAQTGDRPRPDKFRLRGARTIFTSETPFDGLLDEVAVKGFVGGDEIVERALYRKPLSFRGQGLLIFVTNNHMRIMDQSLGMRRRMKQVPWHANIPLEKQIANLDKQIIEEEAEGVLAWLVRGAVEYYKQGIIDIPEAVKTSTEAYLENEDDLADFMSQVIDRSDPEAVTDRATLYMAFTEWAEKAGLALSSWSQSKLSRELSRRGLVGCKLNGARAWAGVRINRR